MDRISYGDLIALLNSTPETARTVRYIEERSCGAYTPHHGRKPEQFPHLLDHTRSCFNCRADAPEHLGRCWGNSSCEIWVCATCVPTVEQALTEATKIV